MIKYVSGDILLSKAEGIAHGVAPNDDFKQGLALSIRKQWPALYKDFRHFCKTTHPKEGSVWSWKGAGGPVIFNLLTQEHPSHQGTHAGKASVSYVNMAMHQLLKELKEKPVKSLALTKVATGVGGLNWEDVKPVVEKHLSDLNIPVYVYEDFKRNIAATEEA